MSILYSIYLNMVNVNQLNIPIYLHQKKQWIYCLTKFLFKGVTRQHHLHLQIAVLWMCSYMVQTPFNT